MRATSKTVQTTEIGMLLVLLTWPTADLGGRQTLGALPGRLGEYVREHVDLTPDGHRQLVARRTGHKVAARRYLEGSGDLRRRLDQLTDLRLCRCRQRHRAVREGSELPRHQEDQGAASAGRLRSADAADALELIGPALYGPMGALGIDVAT